MKKFPIYKHTYRFRERGGSSMKSSSEGSQLYEVWKALLLFWFLN